MSYSKRRPVVSCLILVAGAIVVTMLFPFVWLISTSLKGMNEAFSFPPSLFPESAKQDNYTTVWKALPFGRFLLNSLFVAGAITCGQVISCVLAAYAFSRMSFPGRDILFFLYLSTIMLPIHVTLVPSFILIRRLGMVDTYQGLILPFLFGRAYGVFLLRQFFITIPMELEEAAKIDGLGSFGILLRIILPLAKPALATLTVFTFTYYYNDFLWPLVVISSRDKMPVTVGLALFQGIYITDWPLLMAGATIAIIPVLVIFLIFQRYYVEGIAFTGLKA